MSSVDCQLAQLARALVRHALAVFSEVLVETEGGAGLGSRVECDLHVD